MRQAPKTAVLNWLRGIEVSQDSPEDEIGDHCLHSHDDRDSHDDRGSGGESRNATPTRPNLVEVEGADKDKIENLSYNRPDIKIGEETSFKIQDSLKNDFGASQPEKSFQILNHQHAFEFVEEEITFIINVDPEEPCFEPLYREHSSAECPILSSFSTSPLTKTAPQTTEDSNQVTEIGPRRGNSNQVAVEGGPQEEEPGSWFKKEKKKTRLPIIITPENRLSRINEEEESDHASRCKINEGEESKLGEEVFSSPSQNEEDEVVCNKSHRNLDVFDDCVLASELSQNKTTSSVVVVDQSVSQMNMSRFTSKQHQSDNQVTRSTNHLTPNYVSQNQSGKTQSARPTQILDESSPTANSNLTIPSPDPCSDRNTARTTTLTSLQDRRRQTMVFLYQRRGL